MMHNKSGPSNNLQIYGNRESMNLNAMILTNIQASNYFKTNLYELKTYHSVIDEIYYRVKHLEPWEKGSRRTHGLTGMCGGVRGVGGGGIVSSCFCLLYKLYTLKMTRKQVIGLFTHQDSPYIRALGFMYVRYTQDPQTLIDWYQDYLDDEEEIDVKAGGGYVMTIGQMLRQWLTRLEWFDTLFPRIPVPTQNYILDRLRCLYGNRVDSAAFFDSNSGAASDRSISKRSPPPEITNALNRHKHGRSSRSPGRRERRNSSDSDHKESSRKRHKSRSRSRSVDSSHSDKKERRRHHKHKHSSSQRKDSADEDADGKRESHRSSHKSSHRHRANSSDESTYKKRENSKERKSNGDDYKKKKSRDRSRSPSSSKHKSSSSSHKH